MLRNVTFTSYRKVAYFMILGVVNICSFLAAHNLLLFPRVFWFPFEDLPLTHWTQTWNLNQKSFPFLQVGMLAKLGQSLVSFLRIWIFCRGSKTLEIFKDFHFGSKIQTRFFLLQDLLKFSKCLGDAFTTSPFPSLVFQPSLNSVCSHTIPRNFLLPKLARASFRCLQPENPDIPFYTWSICNAEMLSDFSQGCSTIKRVVTLRLLIQCSFHFARQIKMIIQHFFKMELNFPMVKMALKFKIIIGEEKNEG